MSSDLLALPWIDVHAHFSPPRTPAQAQSAFEAYHAAHFLVPCPPHWDAQSTIAHMDSAGTQMQLLSNIPRDLASLQASNTYGSQLSKQYPGRFGFLVAVPTDSGGAALTEALRGLDELGADGVATTACYNGRWLSDPDLGALWDELDRRAETVHVHPNAYADGHLGRPAPLIEVAFESARGVVEMLYSGMLERWPNIRFIISHCGGAFPALSGRLSLLGAQSWVPHRPSLTAEQIPALLSTLFVDVAATAQPQTLWPAVEVVGPSHLVYGSDCGVQCSTAETMEANKRGLLAFRGMEEGEREAVGRKGWEMFPRARERYEREVRKEKG